MKRMMAAAAALVAMAGPVAADVEKRKAEGTVAAVMNRLVEAVEDAGAMVFARVDHAGGAQTVGMQLRPMELLIFGNPQLGTPALQDNALSGLVLPLRVLAYEDSDGQVWLAWQEPEDMIEEVGGDDDADYIEKMEDALENLTRKAAKD
jgi:uncharacterized protein (DUF302 family)